MTESKHDKKSNVIPFHRAPRTLVPIDAESADVDEQVIAALGRHFNAVQERTGPREIELNAEDLKALESERDFKSRFGFALGPRGRAALFEVILELDLTTDEVKSLHRIGAIKWDGHRIRIVNRPLLMWFGAFYLALVLLFGVIVGTLIIASPANAPKDRAVLSVVIAAIALTTYGLYCYFIWPSHVIRSRRKKATKKQRRVSFEDVMT